jgi:hypothetical protein
MEKQRQARWDGDTVIIERVQKDLANAQTKLTSADSQGMKPKPIEAPIEEEPIEP